MSRAFSQRVRDSQLCSRRDKNARLSSPCASWAFLRLHHENDPPPGEAAMLIESAINALPRSLPWLPVPHPLASSLPQPLPSRLRTKRRRARRLTSGAYCSERYATTSPSGRPRYSSRPPRDGASSLAGLLKACPRGAGSDGSPWTAVNKWLNKDFEMGRPYDILVQYPNPNVIPIATLPVCHLSLSCPCSCEEIEAYLDGLNRAHAAVSRNCRCTTWPRLSAHGWRTCRRSDRGSRSPSGCDGTHCGCACSSAIRHYLGR